MKLLLYSYIRKTFSIICVCIYGMSNLHALPAEPTLKVSVNKKSILAGEQFKVGVELITELESEVQYTNPSDSSKGFLIIDQQRITTLASGKLKKTQLTFTLISTDQEATQVPPFTFTIISPYTIKQLSTKAIPITVLLLPVDVTVPHKTLFPSVPITYTKAELYPYFTFIAIVLVGLFSFAYRSKLYNLIAAIKRLYFYQRSLNKIKHLKHTHDIATKLPLELRKYLSGYIGLRASTSTTEEIVKELRNKNIDKQLVDKLQKVLKETDRIKFSYQSGSSNQQELVIISKEFVQLTKNLN